MLKKSHIVFFVFSLVVIILLCPTIYAKTTISEGIAFIGSGVTLEDAKLIALNDALQKALDSLGVFVESETQVTKGRVTKDEIRIITGALMTSKILEIKKEVLQDIFVVKVRAEFNIDEVSLHQALKNYQDRSKDQKTIQHLMKTVEKLQAEFLLQKKDTYEAIELVDEINYSINKLGKLLTTKQVINYELQMQELFKKKFIKTFPKCYTELIKLMNWETTPFLKDNRLGLKFIGQLYNEEKLKKAFKKSLGHIMPIVEEYNELNLKIHPKFRYRVIIDVPVYAYINAKQFLYTIKLGFELDWCGRSGNRFFIGLLPFTAKKNIQIDQKMMDLLSLIQIKLQEINKNKLKDRSLLEFELRNLNSNYCKYTNQNSLGGLISYKQPEYGYPSMSSDGELDIRWHHLDWNIDLPKIYGLSDIENVEVRIGRINSHNIQFSFFDKAQINCFSGPTFYIKPD